MAMKAAQLQDLDLEGFGQHRSTPSRVEHHMPYPYAPLDTSNGNGHGNGNGNGNGNGYRQTISPFSPLNDSRGLLLHNGPPDFSSQASSSTIHPSPNRVYSSFTFSPGKGTNDIGSLSWLDALVDGSGSFLGSSDPFVDASTGIPTQYASEQAQLLSLESPEHPYASGIPGTMANLVHPTRSREPQLEDVTSWANVSHFISLFLQYSYPILPLVHRPTFSEHLATRRDLRDSDFRALLLSIGESPAFGSPACV